MLSKFFKLNVKDINDEALAEIEPLMPKQYMYSRQTRDLRNITPTNFMIDNKGNRVAGRFGVSDAMTGTASPVIWAFFLPILFLCMLSVVTFSVAALLGAWIPFKEWSHSIAGTPTIAWAVWDAIKGIWTINLLGALPSIAVYYYGYVVLVEMDPNRKIHHLYWFAMVPSFFVITTLLPALSPLVGALGSLLVPYILFNAKLEAAEAAREQNLRDATSDTRGITALPFSEELEIQREKQAKDALAEVGHDGGEVELIIMGISKGILRKDGDPLTPDCGAPIGFSSGVDAAKGIFAFGKPGKGKTSAVAKRVAGYWCGKKGIFKKRMGGALFMDLKGGSLVKEFHHSNYLDIYVDPSNKDMDPDKTGKGVNLFGSLDAQRFGVVLNNIASGKGSEKDIWGMSASDYAVQARVIIAFAVSKGVKSIGGVDVRDGFCCFGRFIQNEIFRSNLLTHLSENFSNEIKASPSLFLNFNSWGTRFPALHDGAKSSVGFTLDAWVSSLLGAEKLEALLDDDGIDLADLICNGKVVGSTLCAKDGAGALLAQALIKAAVYGRIQDRGTKENWQELGESRVLVMIDECSKGLDESDEILASQGRSLGLVLCFMTQDINQLWDRLGKEKTHAMLICFGQLICFESSGDTYQYMAGGDGLIESARIGARYRLVKDGLEQEVSLLQSGINQESSSGLENMTTGAFGDFVGSITTTLGSMRRLFSLQWQSEDKNKNMLRTQNTDKYRSELRPALMASEMSAVIVGRHIALVAFDRADIRIREVVDCTPGIEDREEEGKPGSSANARSIEFINKRIKMQEETTKLGFSRKKEKVLA